MASYIVTGSKPGVVMFTRDGVIEHELSFPPGVYSTATIEKWRYPGQVVVYDRPLMARVGNSLTCKPVEQFDSAANPHFRMTAAARQVRELRALTKRNEALMARVRKGVSAMGRARRAVPQIADQSQEVQSDAGEVSAT